MSLLRVSASLNQLKRVLQKDLEPSIGSYRCDEYTNEIKISVAYHD